VTGGKIFIVEDGVAAGRLIAVILMDAGYEVIGPATTNGSAVDLIDSRSPDAVLLDINLGSNTSFPVAELLTSLGTPFAFMTGNEPDEIPTHLRSNRLLRKPMSIEAVLAEAVFLTASTANARRAS
jgi:DNA-binding response OmpR family regulator